MRFFINGAKKIGRGAWFFIALNLVFSVSFMLSFAVLQSLSFLIIAILVFIVEGQNNLMDELSDCCEEHLKQIEEPDYAISPGEVLGVELELRGMTQQELARRTGITPKHIISILKAKTPITPEMAIKLERALGMPVEYWLNLEANYQEVLASVSQ